MPPANHRSTGRSRRPGLWAPSRAVCHACAVAVFATVLLAGLPGCTPRKDRSGALKGITTHVVTLENEHTGRHRMSITLPVDFVAEWAPESRDDVYFIYRASDTGQVQRAMVMLQIMRAGTSRQIKDTAEFARAGGVIAGVDVEWRERTLAQDDGPPIVQREVLTGNVLESGTTEREEAPLRLYAFAVGSNEREVERLVACVETLAFLPMKPNL